MHSSTGGRTENQDAADHFAEGALHGWVLADGLGGHRGGGRASSIVTEALVEACRAEGRLAGATIAAAAREAQSVLTTQQEAHPEYRRMRSTFVLLLADREAEAALWGHAGDSRLYHFRDGAIAHQTRDHSVVQVLVEAGEIDADEMRDHSGSHRILRALGGDADDAAPDVREEAVRVRAGDAFLLCSDGFWEGVTEAQMLEARAEAATPAAWIESMTARLAAPDGAGQDNHTALAVYAR
jgi:serine/threonine protein phosphatase PrpC